MQAPNGTQLEVPVPEPGTGHGGGSSRRRYQIHLKSDNGQIYVLLVNKDAGADPVVVQVPPPAEEADHVTGGEERLSAEQEPPQAAVKQEEFQELDFGEESYSEQDNSVEGVEGNLTAKRPQAFDSPASKRRVAHDFAMPSVGAEIPGLDELIASESKIFYFILYLWYYSRFLIG